MPGRSGTAERNGHPDQHWSLHLLNPGSGPGALYQLYNQQSGLCLSISAFSRANGVQTVQLGCQDPTATQSLWQIHPAGNGSYILQPAASRNADLSNSMCLDVRGGSTSDGTVLEQWTCNGGLNQRFYLDGGAPPAPWSRRLLGLRIAQGGTSCQVTARACRGQAGSPW
jgi:hypothetical protein